MTDTSTTTSNFLNSKWGLLVKVSALVVISVLVFLWQSQGFEVEEQVFDFEETRAQVCKCTNNECLNNVYLSISSEVLLSEEWALEQEELDECIATLLPKQKVSVTNRIDKKAPKNNQKRQKQFKRITPEQQKAFEAQVAGIQKILDEAIAQAKLKKRKRFESKKAKKNVIEPVVINNFTKFSKIIGKEVLITQKNGTEFIAKLVAGKKKEIVAKRFLSGGVFTFPLLEKNIDKIKVLLKPINNNINMQPSKENKNEPEEASLVI